MSELTNHIEQITGIGSGNSDSDFLESAQRFVAASVPKDLLLFAQVGSSASSDGSEITFTFGDSIVDVLRDGYKCKEIPRGESKWALDPNSLKKATKKNPVYWFQQNGIQTAPASEDGESTYVYYIQPNKIDSDCDLRNAVVYRAAASEFEKLASGKMVDWSDTVAPSPPSQPDFGGDLTLSLSVGPPPEVTDSVVSFSASAPTYVKPTLTAPTMRAVAGLVLPAPPTAPESPSFTYTDASVEDFIEPLINVTDMASFDIDAPTYMAPELQLSDFPAEIEWIFPSIPIAPIADFSIIQQVVEGLVLPGDVILPDLGFEEPDTLEWTFPEVPVQPTLDWSGVSQVIDDVILPPDTVVPSLEVTEPESITWNFPSAPIIRDVDFEHADTLIRTEEDIELASARLQEISTKVNEYSQSVAAYQAKINGEVSKNQGIISTWGQEWNARVSVFTGKLSALVNKYSSEASGRKAIADAQTAALNAQIQEVVARNQAEVQTYQAKIGAYQADVNALVSKNQGIISVWNSEWQTKVQKFSSETGAKVNVYQATIQGKTQVSAQQIQIRQQQLDEASSVAQTNVALYNSAVQGYQSDISSIVSKNQGLTAVWSQENTVRVQKYGSDTQNALNKFNKENAEYQADIQRKTQNLQKEMQQATANAQNYYTTHKSKLDASVQIGLQNAIQDFQQDVAQYDANIKKFSSELESYNAQSTAAINKWTIEEWTQSFNKYQADYGSVVQTYQADIQNELNEFNKESTEYQAQLQISLQDAQLSSQDDAQKIQRYQQEVQKYQHDVNKEIQVYVNSLQTKTQEYQSKIALYGADIQKYQSEYGELAQKVGLSTQNATYYANMADKYYKWSVQELQLYIQSNSRMINRQLTQQQQQMEAQKQSQQQYRS